jgi:hypothetical protein
MSIRVHFLYCPRSGPRWIAGSGPRSEAALPIVEWPNGCAHAVGHHMSFATATQGAWWRSDACELAQLISQHYRGVAWDDRGEVHLVLPPAQSGDWHHVSRALRLLWLERRDCTKKEPSLDALHLLGDDACDEDMLQALRAVGMAHGAPNYLRAHAWAPARWTWERTERPEGGERWTIQYWTTRHEIASPWRCGVLWGQGDAAQEAA